MIEWFPHYSVEGSCLSQMPSSYQQWSQKMTQALQEKYLKDSQKLVSFKK